MLVTNIDAGATEDPLSVSVKVCRRVKDLVVLSPNPTYSGTLAVKSESTQTLHFYVFDLEGTMVYHALLLPGKERSISDLKKGTYSYDIFQNDESVEQGQITVLEPKKTAKSGIRKKQ